MNAYGDAYTLDNGVWHYAGTREVVPGSSVHIAPDGTYHCLAPELLASCMLNVGAIAELLGVKQNTVHVFLQKKVMPQPQIRFGERFPLWSRPVIERWRASRPGTGAHLRGRGKGYNLRKKETAA